MSVGANIRKRRYELKMSQQDLANAMGYKNRTTIAKIESGENDISQKKLEKMSKVLDTSVETLIMGIDSLNLPESYAIQRLYNTDNKRNKNVVLLMAGGKSCRNLQNIPNQFININNKPIFIYCLEAYESHPLIDDIYIVCLKGWESIVNSYSKQFGINKIKDIINAGSNGILSIKNGIDYLKDKYNENDSVIIQESTRPMVSVELISKLLQTINKTGSASICHSMSDFVQFNVTKENVKYINRNEIVELQSPEGYKLRILKKAFNNAKKNSHDFNETCCAMFLYNLGYYINFIEGNVNNLKIIRQEDITCFSTMLKQKV